MFSHFSDNYCQPPDNYCQPMTIIVRKMTILYFIYFKINTLNLYNFVKNLNFNLKHGISPHILTHFLQFFTPF